MSPWRSLSQRQHRVSRGVSRRAFPAHGRGKAAASYVHPDNNRRAYFSDIGGYIIPDDPDGNTVPFFVGLWPNETYWYGEFSGMSFDPRCSGTMYIGNGNDPRKSLDASASYAIVQRFVLGTDSTAAVEHVQIPRCDQEALLFEPSAPLAQSGAPAIPPRAKSG